MQYLPHTNILCLEYEEFMSEGICEAKGTYDSLKARGQIKVHGRGGNGNPILIEYESMRWDIKEKVTQRYVEAALIAALKGETPAVKETIGRGCRVRYAKERN